MPAEDKYAQALHYVQIDRPKQAQPLLAELLEDEPENANVLALAGGVALETGDTSSAQKLLGQALQIDPHHALAQAFLFDYHRELKQDTEAEKTLLQILERNPEDAQWIATYAHFMLEHLQLEKAEALASEALRLAPEEPRAQYVAVILATMRGDHNTGRMNLASMVRNDPESFQTVMAILLVLLERKRHREALPVAQELLRAYPQRNDLAELVMGIRTQTHWFARPAWPMQKFGWGGAAACYVIGVGGLRLLGDVAPGWLAGSLLVLYILFVIHSWTYERILMAWFRRRGV